MTKHQQIDALVRMADEFTKEPCDFNCCFAASCLALVASAIAQNKEHETAEMLTSFLVANPKLN